MTQETRDKLNYFRDLILPEIESSKVKNVFVKNARTERYFDTIKAPKLTPFALPPVMHKVMTKAAEAMINKDITGTDKPEKKDFHLKLRKSSPCEDPAFPLITDLDPLYYSIVKGRPIRDMVTRIEYTEQIRNLFLLNHKIAICNDVMINIDTAYEAELNEWNSCNERVLLFTEYFEAFLRDDSTKTGDLLAKQKHMHKVNREAEAEARVLEMKQASLQHDATNLYSDINRLRMFQQFLATLHSEVSGVFGQIRTSDFDDLTSGINFETHMNIDDIVEYSRSLQNNKYIEYFTKPTDIPDILELLNQMSFLSMSTAVKLRYEVEELIKNLNDYKQAFKRQSKEIRENIDELEDQIKYTENEAETLKNKYLKKVGKVFPVFASKSVLNLYLLIELSYKTIFNSAGTQPPIYLLKEMELYREANMAILDKIDLKIVQKVVHERNAAEIKKYNKALKARRVLQHQTILSNSLRSAIDTRKNFERQRQFIINRKEANKTSNKNDKGRKELTAEEKQYLYMFTHWCVGQDPEPFLRDRKEVESIIGDFKK